MMRPTKHHCKRGQNRSVGRIVLKMYISLLRTYALCTVQAFLSVLISLCDACSVGTSLVRAPSFTGQAVPAFRGANEKNWLAWQYNNSPIDASHLSQGNQLSPQLALIKLIGVPPVCEQYTLSLDGFLFLMRSV